MIFWIIVFLVIIIAIALIGMVLLQPSKGGGSFGSAFGGLGGTLGSTFGSRRTLDFLAKGTAYSAGALAILCLIANLFFIPHGESAAIKPVTTGTALPGGAPAATPTLPQGGASNPATGGGAAPAPAGQGNNNAPAPAGGTQQQPAPTPAPANR